jgi:hypothetical protein
MNGGKQMAMAMTRKRIPGRKPIFEWLFPKKVRETRCSKCGRPFLEHPDREPTHRFVSKDVELMIYAQHSGIRREHWLRVGVWRRTIADFQFSQLIDLRELLSLQKVVAEAVEFMKVEEEYASDKPFADKIRSSRNLKNEEKEDYGK